MARTILDKELVCRTTRTVHRVFDEEARKRSITKSDLLRQLITSFVRNPRLFDVNGPSTLDAEASLKSDDDVNCIRRDRC